ncbi:MULTISPECIES: 3-phenylpropionate/cinnamic acid dioxygenase subunit beta [unclassified Streptomyces]|uniref:3-phenylpropionate/cinnamic acid dioxygenase subunit beta n=1 Tax=unclassified Streptomyces TaxID=2593676 RepID=UPI00081D460D|nr:MULTISPECIES: 3-phenylpropionate/cinnamic acid dioxygenase subunit beta [unclassified Streptomyces]MYZ33798.1 3-phenylpropionate/cinnamic acid dioxygenase subunit beta [Streptomyces sp. SID4917]SCF61856.1 3-phenylpropionate/cinnamic acid dioxygenase, small subunit [Streptomyces sp. MnatMP-M17]
MPHTGTAQAAATHKGPNDTVSTSTSRAGARADHDTHFEVEQFYYEEADLLDAGRYTDWLGLLAEDLDYWMPTRTNRLRRQQALSVAARGEAAFYDETKESLAWRIRRFDSGMAWAEDPPSRTRHLVTNVLVRHIDPEENPDFAEDDLLVRSAFLVYRNRLEREENVFAGGRTDILRRTRDGLRVARRTILLDQNILQAKNISTFF